jgi:pimeloyl-ACP methyl ester carboxylesterase
MAFGVVAQVRYGPAFTDHRFRKATCMPFSTRLLAVGIAGSVVAATFAVPASAAPAAALGSISWANTYDKTSAAEKKRVDSVKTPKLAWYKCYETAECATVRLPLDYDKPKGATTEIAVLRVKARNQKAKIGSLFVNPGGPGGSGTDMAYGAPFYLGDEMLDKFDVVGFDPRGIASSDNIKCFKSTRDQTLAYAGMNVAFPYTKAQEAAYVKSAKAIGKGCSTTGKALAGAMSTAEVARDMDVLRRAVGDKKLTFLGFSYGSALGQYYANMFPDRVRSVVVDGVIDPTSWVGNSKTQNTIQDDRMRSSDGAYKALIEILKRCDAAGPKYCQFSDGDPVKNFEKMAASLRIKPVVVKDPEFGDFTISYADFVGTMLGALYSPTAGAVVASLSQELWGYLYGTPALKASAKAALIKRVKEARGKPSRDFPYDSGFEGFSGVMCTDGLHPKNAASWPAAVVKSDKRAPYFGRAWGWGSAQCARDTWTVKDEDAYKGPFTKRTVAPILVVGNYWDPATNYQEAVSSSKLLPNSRLLSSTNWGHTAYGSSACTTNAIDAYLLRGTLPTKGKVCVGDIQPFTDPLVTDPPAGANASRVPSSISELAAKRIPAKGSEKQLPPVATRIPATVLNGGVR